MVFMKRLTSGLLCSMKQYTETCEKKDLFMVPPQSLNIFVLAIFNFSKNSLEVIIIIYNYNPDFLVLTTVKGTA